MVAYLAHCMKKPHNVGLSGTMHEETSTMVAYLVQCMKIPPKWWLIQHKAWRNLHNGGLSGTMHEETPQSWLIWHKIWRPYLYEEHYNVECTALYYVSAIYVPNTYCIMHQWVAVCGKMEQYKQEIILYFYFSFIYSIHYSPVSQANWCNMTFTAGNLLPSHSYIGWPTPGFEPRSPACLDI